MEGGGWTDGSKAALTLGKEEEEEEEEEDQERRKEAEGRQSSRRQRGRGGDCDHQTWRLLFLLPLPDRRKDQEQLSEKTACKKK